MVSQTKYDVNTQITTNKFIILNSKQNKYINQNCVDLPLTAAAASIVIAVVVIAVIVIAVVIIAIIVIAVVALRRISILRSVRFVGPLTLILILILRAIAAWRVSQ